MGDIVEHIIEIHFLQSEKCKTLLELELIYGVSIWWLFGGSKTPVSH